ncbi:MAG: DUF4389 domain-containing protein [Candidatus Altimarinota bacterium]
MAKDKGPQQISLSYPYRETISRLFIFRFLWMFIVIWPMMVWGFWMSIILFLHFWYMLFLGKRHEGFWKRQVRFYTYVTRWNSYFNLMVDQRPDFIE